MGPGIVARYAIVDHDATGGAHVRGGRGRRRAGAAAARVRRGRRAHRHRVRRAPLLRRFQRRPQGGVPGAGRHRDHPGGTPPPAHRRRPRHLRHPGREPGARLRPCRHGAGTTAPLARRRHQPGAPGGGRLRRPAARGPRRRLRARRGRPRCARWRRPSTSSCRPTAGTRWTATSTRPSRAWPPPSGSCATAGSSSWPRPARTGCRRAARSPACWRARHSPADLAGATGEPELDRWQAQVLGRVLARAEVHLHAGGLDERAIAGALLVPAPDLDGAVAAALERLGPGRGWPSCPRARSPWRRCARSREGAHPYLTPVSGIESPTGARRSAVRLRRPRGPAARGGGPGAGTPTWSRTSTSCRARGRGSRRRCSAS